MIPSGPDHIEHPVSLVGPRHQMVDAEVYAHLGDPETEDVRTRDGQPPGPHAPAMLVAPIRDSKISDTTLLQESIIVGDFG